MFFGLPSKGENVSTCLTTNVNSSVRADPMGRNSGPVQPRPCYLQESHIILFLLLSNDWMFQSDPWDQRRIPG